MKKSKLNNVVAHTLFVLVKHKDENGMLYFCKKLTDDFDKEAFSKLLNYFFNFYKDSLEEDDFLFFQQTTDNFVNEVRKQLSTDVEEEERLKKLKKGVAFFEKIGFRLGEDYSFKNGNFYMSKKNKLRLKTIMER